MKIFISHSSHDKWAARWISKDLITLGATTFLDEKDIETGESIDEALGKHLVECDEILILLSPASLKSHWVFIEVGGAKALGKRLIPILLHVPMNEVPQPITKHLARDINDIEKYYSEVSKRILGKPPKVKVEKKKPVKRKPIILAPGDRVRIVNPASLTPADKASGPGWANGMDQYGGMDATVMEFDPSGGWAKLDVDEEGFFWLSRWLIKK